MITIDKDLGIKLVPETDEGAVLLRTSTECSHEPAEFCFHCCDHQDLENMHCIDCGADRTEEIMSRAYDRAKDFRKYGDA